MPCKYSLSIGCHVTYNDVEFGEVTFTAGALLGTNNARK